MTADVLPHEFAEAEPTEVVFWSGAGISVDAPTQAPAGEKLTERVLAEVFTPAVIEDLRAAYAALDIKRTFPRLETILDIAVQEHQLEILPKLLGDIASAPPNGDHVFFAEHTAHGGFHITANFDTCIERAGGISDRIVHFHGQLEDDRDLGALGVRLSRIDPGFDPEMVEQLDAALRDARYLVVAGYGGVDYFDVDPYWTYLNERSWFDHKSVLWIEHSESSSDLTAQGVGKDRYLNDLIQSSTCKGYELKAPTRQVLASFAEIWGMSAVPAPPLRVDRREPDLGLSPESREHATTRFFVFAGLHDKARLRLQGAPRTEEERRWKAELAWTAGQYRECARQWELVFPGTDAGSRAAREERIAATRWLRGQFRLAFKHLSKEIQLAEASDEVPAETVLTMAETLARIYINMRRSPDSRAMATAKKRKEVLAHLDNVEKLILNPLGIELRNRINSVRASLTGEPYDQSKRRPDQDFGQSERLIGMLNYMHGRIRGRVESGGPPPTFEECMELSQGFRTLGNYADATRTPLLPMSAIFFQPIDVWRGFQGPDFTEWHRLRLFFGYLFRYLKMKLNLHRRSPSVAPRRAS